MGGAVSTGINNDDLIDNLIEAHFINTPLIEKVFRTVDRAFYFLPEFRKAAYKDLAWKHENLHLSAPCIYSKVLEELNLASGQSFLNIGSGTGYLSTMIGLILGPYGINHGVEIHEDVVDYAYKKLDQFKKTCSGVDVFEFCEPSFVVGNGFHLQSDRKYDRIYCGAACPSAYHDNIKEFLKVGGILIVPCEDDLLKFIRKSQSTWEVHSVLQVSFSTLQLPDRKISNKTVDFEETHPPYLQSLCRTSIRTILRNVCENDDPTLNRPPEKPVKEERKRKFNAERHLVIPIFENLSGTETIRAVPSSHGRLNFGRLIFQNYSATGFQTFIRNLTRGDEPGDDEFPSGRSASGSDQLNTTGDDDGHCEETLTSSSQQSDADEDDGELMKDLIRCTDKPSSKILPSIEENQNVTDTCYQQNKKMRDSVDSSSNVTPSTSLLQLQNENTTIENTYGIPRLVSMGEASSSRRYEEFEMEQKDAKSSSSRIMKSEDEDEDFCHSQPKKIAKREKLDSGISEESDDGKVGASNESSYSESTFSEAMDVESDDSDFSDYSSNETRFSSDFDGNDWKFDSDESKMTVKYRMALEKRIQALPLPNSIKIYLNYDREFKFPC